MLQSISTRHHRSRRGIAIMIAISILAILTILGFALAASVDFSTQEGKQSVLRHEFQRSAWFGLDTAKALLAKAPDELLGKPKTLTLDNGTCVITAESAKADAPYYSGSSFKFRSGDVDVALAVTVQGKKSEAQVKHYRYLVNVAPGTERVVALLPTATVKDVAVDTTTVKGK